MHTPCTLWFKLSNADSTDGVDLDQLLPLLDLDHLLVTLFLATAATEEGFLLLDGLAHRVYLEILFNSTSNKNIRGE